MNKQDFDNIYETISFIKKGIIEYYKRKYSSENIEMDIKYHYMMVLEMNTATKPYYDYITKCMQLSTEVDLITSTKNK